MKSMKPAWQWLAELSEEQGGHSPACACNRCKNGREVFLLRLDIAQIQIDALGWAWDQMCPDGNPENAMAKMVAKIDELRKDL